MGRASISEYGMIRSLSVDAGYQGRGFEGLMLGSLMEQWRTGGGRAEGVGSRPHVWVEEGEEAVMEAALLGLGFEVKATASILQAQR